MILRVGKETFGNKKIEEAFKEAFEPYFQEEFTVENIINNQKVEEKEK